MLISTRKGTIIRSTLNHASKIDPGVLPQHRAQMPPRHVTAKGDKKMHGTLDLAFLPHLKEGVSCEANR